jgi:SNF2 family DNA or RNA helicase
MREIYLSRHDEAKQVIDVLAIYIYPVDVYTLTDAVHLFREIPQDVIIDILQELIAAGIVVRHVTGSYSLDPAMSFMLFPEKIKETPYLQLLQQVKPHSFYSTSARIQELQQLLLAYFTGERSLLRAPVMRISGELNEYLPHICYLLYYPVYKPLLQLFDADSLATIYHAAIGLQLQSMSPITLSGPPVSSWSVLAGTLTPGEDPLVNAVIALYDQQPDAAFLLFEQGIKQQAKTDRKHLVPLSPVLSFIYAFNLTLLPDSRSYPLITKIVTFYDKKLKAEITPAISLLHFHQGRKEKAENLLALLLESKHSHLLSYLALICLQACLPGSKLLKTYKDLATQLLYRGIENNYPFLTYEYLYLFRDEGFRKQEAAYTAAAQVIGKRPLLSQLKRTAEWERLLKLLSVPEAPQQEKPAQTARIAYLLDPTTKDIQVIIQSFTNAAGWSRGRPVDMKRFVDGSMPGMTPQDEKIAACLIKQSFYSYGSDDYVFEDRVWAEMAGHPYLYMAHDQDISFDIVKGEPELLVNKTGKGYTFDSNLPTTDLTKDIIFIRESETRLRVIRLSPRQKGILQTVQQMPLVPVDGREQLLTALQQIGAHITVHANLDGAALNMQQRQGDARITVQLQPTSDALKAAFFVKPFGADPPYCKPGEGAAHIIGIMNGERCQATRDLEAEKANYARLLEYIQQAIAQEIDDDHIIFSDPLDCLQLLEVIHEHPELAISEWPEGEKLRIKKVVATKRMMLTVKSNRKWLECQGELKVDEDMVLSLKELLDKTVQHRSRFIPLKNGNYLALTRKLYRQLQEMNSFITPDSETVKIQAMAAHMLDDLLEDAGSVETDAAFKAHRQRWKEIIAVTPAVPAALQATLRPYQEDGFRWLARLATLGAGACLADDMGLGKTIQAITLLLHRGAEGPALVVCPASVLPNWINEINRFAPSLRVIRLHAGGDRKEVLAAVGTCCVVVTTYGLLLSERTLLTTLDWDTVILDEAQAIKNYQTRTAKAALALRAHFRLILTGTPIQNNLNEIWSLFHFINPGLLGTLRHFVKQYTTPVVYNPDSTVKVHLKKLIAPYMLRRTKGTVLDELPEKTEIVKLIPLSHDERAFYEAIRLKAIENIRKYRVSDSKQHMNTLTEIGKLRMAACHPQMLHTEVNIPSSKLSTFMEIAEELISNKHRALVFSQFVRHLELVKRALDDKGISYLYLDGATAIPDREERVKQFQGGTADLFLISLKAGGLGLNLTAADYVIHLDPWWNPAIEEQASDRAYRMGQTKPVTIYRLVMQDTIEEKIISLHRNKRDLADQLLQGSDITGKLTTEELIALITK